MERDPRQQGYAFARWTCARLAVHLEQHAGVHISLDWGGEVLRRHGFGWPEAVGLLRRIRRRGSPPSESLPLSGISRDGLDQNVRM
ncbi:winged helix-turn-helix domain-containing protein [Hyalangium minutum]|nr:winged helix-turn-helix domain-containing protein [Hyalangium minutum]